MLRKSIEHGRNQKWPREHRLLNFFLTASIVPFVWLPSIAGSSPAASGSFGQEPVPLAGVDQATGLRERPIVDDDDPRVKMAVARAAALLRAKRGHSHVGELALMINALAKVRARYPDLIAPDDPVMEEWLSALRRRATGEFRPTRQGGHDNYEAGCAAMALAGVDREKYAAELTAIAQYLIAKQLPNGSWSYDGQPSGDTSMTQYALLGLWEAGSAGASIPKQVFDRAAQWLVTRQAQDGGFAYHPPEPGANARVEPTHTMTVGSLGSLYICRHQLAPVRRQAAAGPLLPAAQDERAFKPAVEPAAIDEALKRATDWLEKNFTLDRARGEADPGGGRWLYYYLYAFERFGSLAERQQVAGTDWYSRGAALLLSKQQADGSWDAGSGPEVDTSFAVLFLVRSTRMVLKEVRQQALGRGVLVPVDVRRLLARDRDADRFLLDADAAIRVAADSAAIGNPFAVRDWTAVGPKGAVAWKGLVHGYESKDSPLIIAALKQLARTQDYRVVPLLIDAMYYEDDEGVMLAARDALCLISRRFEPQYRGTTVEEWQQEIDRWKSWYRSVRPHADAEDVLALR